MSAIDSRVVNIDQLKLEHSIKAASSRPMRTPRAVPRRQGPRLFVRRRPARQARLSFSQPSRRRGDVFVVKGEGTLRYGDETRKIRAGDVICCPTGGPETAHQIVNDSDAALAYLSVSTMCRRSVPIPGFEKDRRFGGGLRHMTRVDHHIDYWADEM